MVGSGHLLFIRVTAMWYIHILQALILFFSLVSFTALSLGKEMTDAERPTGQKSKLSPITLFLTGDVMTGRGIDQVLPHPNDPRIYEPYVRDAGRYVEIAEKAMGPIKRPVDWPYIWGIALDELGRLKPDVRIINLETAVTKSDEYWRGKGINYRMHPKNIPAITVAGINVAVLGNNHVLDWGYSGLEETLETLKRAKISHTGAGLNLEAAQAPAILEVSGKGRVLVFSYASGSSGVPPSWAASDKRPGVNLLNDLSGKTIDGIRGKVNEVRRRGDIVVASLHWGGNWGYDIGQAQRNFARRLIDEAGVDIVHGHSSHHLKGIEVHGGKLILYGCGDLITDYEGIGSYEEFRGDLGLLYFPTVDPLTGRLLSLKMIPTQMRRFRLDHASKRDAAWMKDILNREGESLGTEVNMVSDGSLKLKWN